MTIDDADVRRCLALLELAPGASFDAVRAAYRTLTQVWHPDRFAGQPGLQDTAARRQQELNEAYRLLVRHYRTGTGSGPEADRKRPGRLAGTGTGTGAGAARVRALPVVAGEGAWDGREERRAAEDVEAGRAVRSPRGRRVVYAAAVVLGLFAAGIAARSHSASEIVSLDGAPVRASALASGGAFSCAAAEQRVICWRHAPFAPADVPAAVVRLDTDIRGIAVGMSHACALLRDGAIQCWGGNFTGALGDRSLDDRRRPVPVRFDGTFTAVSALGQHTCALDADGSAWCWGSDADGQLGVGEPVARCTVDDAEFYCSDRPERVTGSGGWRAVAAGGSHSCALDADGRARCWGANLHGQVGTGSAEACAAAGGARPCVRKPTLVEGAPAPLAAVSAGAAHACALDDAGVAWCWGLNDHGQTGGSAPRAHAVAEPVADDVRFRAIAAGGDHTCAIGVDDDLYCWGSDARGALRGVAPDRCDGVPCARTPVRLARDVADVDAGFGITCVRRTNGNVRCWGDGDPVLAIGGHAAGADGREAAGSPRPLEGAGAAIARVRWRLDAAQRFLYRTLVMPIEE